MVRKIYDNLGTVHNFVVPSADENRFDLHESILKTGVNELEGCAEIFVAAYGADILHQLRKTLRNYCVQQISAINLFLKLTDPLTYWLTEEIEKMGFFFAGILPETRIGDALMLQYLNNVCLDYDKIQLLSDISRELLIYIKDHDPNIID
jgi:serine/threonine-protein kinase RsbW